MEDNRIEQILNGTLQSEHPDAIEAVECYQMGLWTKEEAAGTISVTLGSLNVTEVAWLIMHGVAEIGEVNDGQ